MGSETQELEGCTSVGESGGSEGDASFSPRNLVDGERVKFLRRGKLQAGMGRWYVLNGMAKERYCDGIPSQ